MPKAGTVPVELTKAEAADVSRWFLKNYRPTTHRFPQACERLAERKKAHSLGRQLEKSAKNKGNKNTFILRVPRTTARWFGAFFKPDGWWDFDGDLVPAQVCPRRIQKVALHFYRAAISKRGRNMPKLAELLSHRTRMLKTDYDERGLRRINKKIRILEVSVKQSDVSTDTLDFSKNAP